MNSIEMGHPYEMSEHCPIHQHEVAHYTQVLMNGDIKIPASKPNLEKIIHVTRKIYLKRVVPIPVKLDNGCIAGCKVLIRGVIRLGIEYSADVPEQTVHFSHFEIPFDALIGGDACHPILPVEDCDLRKFTLCSYTEHIDVIKIDERTIEETIVVLLWLKHKNELVDVCHPLNDSLSYDKESCVQSHTSKQLTLNETCVISSFKPVAEEILTSSVNIEIKRADVINTPIVSLCQHRPFRKVIVIGKAQVIVKYVGEGPDQQVHAIVKDIPIQLLVEWAGGPPEHSSVCVHIIEEYFQVELLDQRSLYIVLILNVDVSRRQGDLPCFD